MNSQVSSVGILSTGVFFPEEVRTNDWWPPEFRARFQERASRDVTTPEVLLGRARSEAQRIQFQQMLESYYDPFRGSRERRVAPPGMKTSEMEIAACRMALQRANVDPAEVDLLMLRSMPSDQISPNNAGLVQAALGLKRCHAIGLDTACCSFLSSAAVAEAMIKTGQARYALVVFSAIYTRMYEPADPLSVNFGDGCAAALIGPVPKDRGFLGHAFKTYGELHQGVAIGQKDGASWYGPTAEPALLYSPDVEAGRAIVTGTADFAKEAVETVLRKAGLEKEQVTHFYAHQSVSWFGAACRLGAGLGHTKTTDTFARFGHVAAANVPLNMHFAQEEGQLKPGDLALLYACGGGLLWSASVLRW